MISKLHLRELIKQRLRDADVLIGKRRYATSVYIAGYALELALKLKICTMFRFTQGFPENKTDFFIYQEKSGQKQLSRTIAELKDIKSHNLNKLLFYSGAEYNVKLNFLDAWNLVVSWTPEMRYKILKIRKEEAMANIRAVSTLVKSIL